MAYLVSTSRDDRRRFEVFLIHFFVEAAVCFQFYLLKISVMNISPIRQTLIKEERDKILFPYGKSRSRNVLADFTYRPSANKIKVFFSVLYRNISYQVHIWCFRFYSLAVRTYTDPFKLLMLFIQGQTMSCTMLSVTLST